MVSTLPIATAGRLVRLTVGPLAVAIPVERILGVERGERVRRSNAADDMTLPTSTGTFRVFELAELLGMEQKLAPRSGQVVLTEIAGERIGLWVERVTQLSWVESPHIAPAPAVAQSGRRFASVALMDDGPLPLLDLDCLLDPRDDTPAPPVVRRRSVSGHVGTSRLIVVGQFEYPGPGGRAVGFGLPTSCVDDITDLSYLSLLPCAPSHVLGLLEWRGRVLPKVDLATWCGVPQPTASSTRVVVVKTGQGERVAVAAGAKIHAVGGNDPHTDARLSLPIRTDRVLGSFEFRDLTVIVPDLSRVAQVT